MEEIDSLLKPAETSFCWQSPNVKNHLQNILVIVADLHERVMKAQDNVIAIFKEISVWKNIPMFSRSCPEGLFDYSVKDEVKTKRYNELIAVASTTKRRLKENFKYFDVDLDNIKLRYIWNGYLHFVDGILEEAVLQMVSTSFSFLLNETDPKLTSKPLFLVKSELFEPEIIFKPSLEKTKVNNFFDMANNLIDDIFKMSKFIQKAEDERENFYEVVVKHKELKFLKTRFLRRVESVINDAKKIRRQFENFSFLWLDNKKTYLYNFLKYSRQPTSLEQETPNNIPEASPKLDDFKKEIDYFEGVYNEIKNMESSQLFDSWFSVDSSPLKSTLLLQAKKWSYMFKQYLLDKIGNSLNSFESFIEDAEISLQSQVSEGDYEGLVKMMGFIKLVKDSQPKYNPLCDELRNILTLLNNYNVDLPEKSLHQLNLLPERWIGVLHMSSTSKQLIASLQSVEVGKLSLKIEKYEKIQRYVRNEFTQSQLFSFSCSKAYSVLDKTFQKLSKVDFEIKELLCECVLFDVPSPRCTLINQCLGKIPLKFYSYYLLI